MGEGFLLGDKATKVGSLFSGQVKYRKLSSILHGSVPAFKEKAVLCSTWLPIYAFT